MAFYAGIQVRGRADPRDFLAVEQSNVHCWVRAARRLSRRAPLAPRHLAGCPWHGIGVASARHTSDPVGAGHERLLDDMMHYPTATRRVQRAVVVSDRKGRRRAADADSADAPRLSREFKDSVISRRFDLS